MAIKIVICSALIIVGFIAGSVFAVIKISDITRSLVRANEGKNKIISIQNRIIESQSDNKQISSILRSKGYEIIAIYGMNTLGKQITDILTKEGMKVRFGIDRRADSIFSDLPIVFPDKVDKIVDAIVVVPVDKYKEIKESLDYTGIPVCSIEEIL